MLAKFKVGLDDGHGMSTAGKRTPIFPDNSGMQSETGNFMHENEFNRAVIKKLGKRLSDIGVTPVYMAPGDSDVSLSERVAIANTNNVDIVVSVHANAHLSQWGPAEGIETFYYDKSAEGKKLATIIQKELVKGTPQKDRGVKTGNFYILRKTKMPSVLIEAGFMDNLREAKLLLSDSFREEVALELFIGVCKYLNVKIDEGQENKPEIPKQDIFRVRTNWDDPMTQNGAYSVLENAIAQAKKLGGDYKVFDSKGKKLYPEAPQWLVEDLEYLRDLGVELLDGRYSEPITRAEAIALNAKVARAITGKK